MINDLKHWHEYYITASFVCPVLLLQNAIICYLFALWSRSNAFMVFLYIRHIETHCEPINALLVELGNILPNYLSIVRPT